MLETHNLTTPKEQTVETTVYREDNNFYYCEKGKRFPKNVWREVEEIKNCAVCGSGFPKSEMVTDEEEGLVCKGCMDNKDACPRGGYVEDYRPITQEEIKAKLEENVFVRSWKSYYAQGGDPMVDVNNDFSVLYCKVVEELKKAFMTYDCHRQCFVYKNLVFVNQTVGGGWEAWTLKKFGDKLIAFESISMQLIIREGTHDGLTFEEYIEFLLSVTKEQCENWLHLEQITRK